MLHQHVVLINFFAIDFRKYIYAHQLIIWHVDWQTQRRVTGALLFASLVLLSDAADVVVAVAAAADVVLIKYSKFNFHRVAFDTFQ